MARKQEEKFFSRKHLVQSGWVLLLSFVCFVSGTLFNFYSGPDKVIVTNSENQEPILVRFEKKTEKPESDVKDYISSLNAEIKLLREILINQDLHYNNDDKEAERIVPNQIQSPKYILPENVEGYSPVAFIGVTDSNCPKTVLKKNEPMIVQFKLLDKSILSRTTPIFFDIVKTTSETSVLEVFSQQFEIKNGLNIIYALIDLPVGEYQMSYGFFLRNELEKKYPNFYSKKCEIIIDE
jgi:hypothetical protein